MDIVLNWYELIAAANTGVLRRISSLKNNITDQMYSRDANPWQIDIEGACAEVACAKALGVYFSYGVNTFSLPDVGKRVQVRYTENPNNCLIIRDRDGDDDIFILVVGSAPKYTVCGWTYGKDGKNKEFLKDANNIHKPAYFIPRKALRPISELETHETSIR